MSFSYRQWYFRPGSLASSKPRTKHFQAEARPAQRQASGPHTGHAVQLPALLLRQDVIQEDALGPVQLLRVVDKRDVLIEQRATCRDKHTAVLVISVPKPGRLEHPAAFNV